MSKGKKNILDNLNSSASGFRTPKDYFEDLEGALYQKLTHEKNKEIDKTETEFNMVRSEGASIKENSQGFKVPENYFEEFEPNLVTSVNKNVKGSKTRVIRLATLSMAASILLFIGIKYMNKGEVTVNNLSIGNQEIVNWVDDELVMFDTYEIAEVFSDTEFDENIYNQEVIQDYLNEIDIESLIIEN